MIYALCPGLSRRYASVQLATAKSSLFAERFSIFHFAKTLLGFPDAHLVFGYIM